jgi:hypothetical protein
LNRRDVASAPRALEEESQIREAPLASVLFVVLGVFLLHGDVREVRVVVVQVALRALRRDVLGGAEPREAQPADERAQRAETRHHHVQAQVKLFAADQQRVVHVPGNDVRLFPSGAQR